VLALLILPQLFIAVSFGIIWSVAILFFCWKTGPTLKGSAAICLLATTLSLWLWLSLSIALLNDINLTANSLEELPNFLTALFLFGSTPIAAGPAVILFRPRNKKIKR